MSAYVMGRIDGEEPIHSSRYRATSRSEAGGSPEH